MYTMHSSQIIFRRLHNHANIGLIRRRLAICAIQGPPAVTCRATPFSKGSRLRPIGPITGSVTSSAPIDRHHHHLLHQEQQLRRLFSTTNDNEDSSSRSIGSTFVVVDHSLAYETAMLGRHGQQLALARLEGVGKDDPPFDPFLEEEDLFEDDDSDDYDETIGAAEADAQTTKEDESDEGYESDDDTDDYMNGDEEGEERNLSLYKPDGSVRREKSVLATLRAGYPSGGLFAVVELGGIQHKVTTDDLMVVNRLKPVDTYKIGSVHTLTDVMLVSSSHMTMVGMPFVTGVEVDVLVEEITQDAKVVIFKKRRRKHSQRKNGYRRDLTMLRVLDIRLPEPYKAHKHVGRDSVDALAKVIPLVSSSSISSLDSNTVIAANDKKAKAVTYRVPVNRDGGSVKKNEHARYLDDDYAPPITVTH